MIIHKNKICIVGAGGFGREVLCCLIDCLKGSTLKIEDTVCFMEEDKFPRENKVMGIDVISQSEFDPALYDVVIAIGDPNRRKLVVDSLPDNTTYATIIHPSAVLSDWVEIGDGSIVTAGSIITCNVKIGKHAHINLHTTIGHDCQIGDFFTTAPGVNVSGKCNIEDCVYLGTNSAVKQGVNICGGVTIGMGGIVVKHIQDSGVYIGNPLKKLEKK